MAWTALKTWVAAAKLTAAEMNTYIRDNLTAAFPDGTTWQAWVPTFANINTLTTGNGTYTARYIQIGDTVHAFFTMTVGSTPVGSPVGSSPSFTLPVGAAAHYANADSPLGITEILNAGTARHTGVAVWGTGDVCFPTVDNTAGTYATVTFPSSTVPMTWAVGDKMACLLTYEVA